MAKYYFLITSLPELRLGVKPEISYEDLQFSLEMNLSEEDKKKAKVLQSYTDLLNLRAFWLKEAIDPRGNLSEKEIEEALLIEDIFPSYVFDFIDNYPELSEKLRHFSFLLIRFFSSVISSEKGFLEKYFLFERKKRLVLAALRAKQTKRDIAQELQHEDPQDPFVADILAQKDSSEYEPPEEFKELKELYLTFLKQPMELHRSILEYELREVEKREENVLYGIDQVLGYMVRLKIIEDWERLDKAEGEKILGEKFG